MQYFIWIIVAGVLLGFYNFSIKLASGHINQILGAVILQFIALMLGGVVLLYLKFTNHNLNADHNGIKFAILAGVFVALAEIASFYVFSKGVNASIGIPALIAVTVLTGVILGVVFLKEALNLSQFIGIILTIVGIVLLSTKGHA